MTRDEVLDLLRQHKERLARDFGVLELSLYGSFARDQGADHSDVDILVRFDEPRTGVAISELRAYLEDLLGRPVDMSTNQELRAEIRPYVEREAIDV